jgi:hypothetical protein
MSAALKNFNNDDSGGGGGGGGSDDADINMAWESITENMKASATEN